MSTSTTISLADVTVIRNGRIIVDHVSLDFEAGQRWALIGPNGSGKSTVLKMTSSWLHPTSGRVEIFGRE
ncbi:MAG: hypothetical protein RLZZ600_690, partial [Actinomycetota bacterium]